MVECVVRELTIGNSSIHEHKHGSYAAIDFVSQEITIQIGVRAIDIHSILIGETVYIVDKTSPLHLYGKGGFRGIIKEAIQNDLGSDQATIIMAGTSFVGGSNTIDGIRENAILLSSKEVEENITMAFIKKICADCRLYLNCSLDGFNIKFHDVDNAIIPYCSAIMNVIFDINNEASSGD